MTLTENNESELKEDQDWIKDKKHKFNFAAFIMPQFWGPGNGVYLGLLAFIPILYPFIAIYLGGKGTEIAYEKSFGMPEKFFKKQRRWQYAAVVYLIVVVLLVVGAIAWPFISPIKVTWSSLPYEYTIHATYIEINRYIGDEEEVVIPDRICFRPVKVLGSRFNMKNYGAFRGNEQIRTVYMPDTIEEMADVTFINCKNLEAVRLSKGLRTISGDSFCFCTSLKSIEIPEGVEEIKNSAFCECSTLGEVVLPESLQKIGAGAFSYCEKLEHIVIPSGVQEIEGTTFEGTPWIDKQEDEFVVAGKNVLIRYQGNSSVVEVPEGIEYIGRDVFEDRSELTHLVFPESLNKIADDSVYLCKNLKYITIKNPDMEIPYDSFLGTAFESCNPDLTLVGEKGSTAEAYAKEHGYNFLESIPEE